MGIGLENRDGRANLLDWYAVYETVRTSFTPLLPDELPSQVKSVPNILKKMAFKNNKSARIFLVFSNDPKSEKVWDMDVGEKHKWE